ncbi:MAG: hypothetical protein JSV45_10640 [Chromatiales bacterium]|nr:MAG: hypothetical protein JSV45_10640 [Chromatiales bacterium]
MATRFDTPLARAQLSSFSLPQRPAIRDLAARIATLADALPETALPAAVADALQPYLGRADLLDPRYTEGDVEQYRRHLLYADPLRRFTILALVWRPGQQTPVHGHTAWGAVGVHQGWLEARSYDLVDAGSGLLSCTETACGEAGPGDTSCVQTGLRDIHRLACRGGDGAISIHVYGRDLSQDPGSINITLPH